MKRWSSAFFLLLFLWLQAYQLCDASEDVVEDFPVAMQLWSAHGLLLSAAIPPDDDDDSAIPSVFDQTLTHGKEFVAFPPTALEWTTTTPPVALDARVVIPDTRSLSPPNGGCADRIGHSNHVVVPSRGTLAPPAA